jgi:hypothetical protein
MRNLSTLSTPVLQTPAHTSRDRPENAWAILVALNYRDLTSDCHTVSCKVLFRDGNEYDDAKVGWDAKYLLKGLLDKSCAANIRDRCDKCRKSIYCQQVGRESVIAAKKHTSILLDGDHDGSLRALVDLGKAKENIPGKLGSLIFDLVTQSVPPNVKSKTGRIPWNPS